MPTLFTFSAACGDKKNILDGPVYPFLLALPAVNTPLVVDTTANNKRVQLQHRHSFGKTVARPECT